uniref:Putative secreted protein n=1 Tax=Anopheles darlingi TaxID=43151 RepID=A0A2M4DMI7_ANODA
MSRSHRWPMSCWRTFLTMVAVMMTMMMTANAFPCRARWMVVMVLVSLSKRRLRWRVIRKEVSILVCKCVLPSCRFFSLSFSMVRSFIC